MGVDGRDRGLAAERHEEQLGLAHAPAGAIPRPGRRSRELLAGPDPPAGATPIRLGQEFRGYAGQVEELLRRARTAQAELLSVPLGGTAVGTGINAHPEYASAPAPGCPR